MGEQVCGGGGGGNGRCKLGNISDFFASYFLGGVQCELGFSFLLFFFF